MTSDLLRATATELLGLYAAGTTSPVEVSDAVLDQIERHNPTLNAFIHLDPDTTRKLAQESEARWAKGEPDGLIDGIPLSIKDLTPTIGWPTRRGSRTTDPNAPRDIDAPVVAAARRHNAVLTGKTATPEFGWKGVTDSPLTGITRNPWNPERTPGGSSGGASAACASFMGPLHQASDGAGSIRIPAAFAGVFGIKATYGLVPNYPRASHIGDMANFGPMARTVADAALLLTVFSDKPDPRDYSTAPVQGQDWRTGLEDGVAGMKIVYAPTLGGYGWADDDVRSAVDAAVDVYRSLGAEVVEAEPEVPDYRKLIDVIWSCADRWILDQMTEEQRALMDPGFVAIAEYSRRYNEMDVIGAYAAAGDLAIALSVFMADYDLMITPAMPLEAFGAGEYRAPGQESGEWAEWSPFTYPFNMSKQPAASVPCGFGDEGMPVAFQLVGRHWDDAKVLRAARAYEREHPFAMPDGYV
ncbi:MAG: amidase [Alphaproteobacteria bacterium]|nr:amidase [Alphaproteobacteria bacterium]